MLTLRITFLLSLLMRISSIGFSTICKFIKISRSHSSSTFVVSNVVCSTLIVDVIMIVCLQEFQETMPPPRVNIYPIVAFLSHHHIKSNLSDYTLQLLLDTQYNEFNSSWFLLDSALPFQVHAVINSWTSHKPA